MSAFRELSKGQAAPAGDMERVTLAEIKGRRLAEGESAIFRVSSLPLAKINASFPCTYRSGASLAQSTV